MKLSVEILRKLVKEEMSKFGDMTPTEEVKAEETDADEFADALEKKIDIVKALDLEESRLQRRLKKIQEQRRRLSKKSNNV
jgi:hypothetical protein